MGNLLRLAVFILALGALTVATGTMLLREHRRQAVLERLLAAPAESAPPPAEQLKLLRERHRDTQRGLVLFAGLAFGCTLLLAITPARPTPASDSPDPVAARTEMRGLETLARATAAQRVELDQEREARHRSEENLTLQQLLANRALQDKVRLGRDLHDGLVQMLYATGLVLETARQKLEAPSGNGAPAANAARLIERAKNTLNAAIRQARDTIGELTPDALDSQNFPDAVASILEHLAGERAADCRVRLAPELPVFADPIRTELLQIIREAVSNAFRHGAARGVEIGFAPLPDGRPHLTIRDDGRGFDPSAVTRGHGLDNLAARARALRAQLEIDAAPGRGTRIGLTLPCPAGTAPAEKNSANAAPGII